MRIEYLHMWKWENLEDGTKEKFIYRLEAVQFELSIQKAQLGCPDITMPAYLPLEYYTSERKKEYESSVIEYNKRQEKLGELLELIKKYVNYETKIDDEYLYELWITRIFELNWTTRNSNPIQDMNILIDELKQNHEINPFDINLQPTNKHTKKRTIKTIIKEFIFKG